MTGMHSPTDQLEQPPATRRRMPEVPPWIYLAAGALVVLALIFTSIYLTARGNASQVSADSANSKVTAVQSQAAPLAGQVQSVCDQGGAGATELNNAGACTQASKVQSAIAEPGPTGPTGPAGPAGGNGRGIASTHLLNGDLVIDYSDGSSADVGTVTGPTGVGGKDGRGITASAIVGQDLVVTYSDGTSSDLGTVVGSAGSAGATGAQGAAGDPGPTGTAGVGVASVVINSSGHLIVTYTDGTTGDAGPVPQAMACPDGSAPSTTDITEPSGLSTTDVPGVLVCSG
jgi:hypothetical protein